VITGSCVCGRFAFEVDGPFGLMGSCHCSYCRKAHGAAYATFAAAPTAGFRWRSGEGEQASYESSPSVNRTFCPDCGSRVPAAAERETAFLPAGLLDGDPGVRPGLHFFTRSKAPWFEITDGVPAIPGLPAGMEDPKLPTPPRPALARAGTIASSCLCGAVAWEVEGVPPRMGSCHCSRCRKLRAAAFSTQAFCAHDAFRWLQGESRVKHFWLAGANFFGNSFCGDCGSPVARAFPQAPMVLLPAGSFDDDPIARPMAHIYVGSKAPWVEIRDGLPTFAEMPPS
jgi:hypothetical protein